MTRAELEQEIQETKQEIQTAGPIRRRDLWRHLRRLTIEARRYDQYQEEAGRGKA